MEKKQIRCQFTKEGIQTFGKQRLGYARESDTDYISVRWDNKKSWNRYSKTFIDTNPLLALYTDDEIAQLTKEDEVPITTEAVLSIERNLKYIKDTGLSEKAIVILLKEYIGASHINKKQIEAVLQALPKLKSYYLIPLSPNKENKIEEIPQFKGTNEALNKLTISPNKEIE